MASAWLLQLRVFGCRRRLLFAISRRHSWDWLHWLQSTLALQLLGMQKLEMNE
jgi:hypothetical protein